MGVQETSVCEVHKFLLREEEISLGYYYIYSHRTGKDTSHDNPLIEKILHRH